MRKGQVIGQTVWNLHPSNLTLAGWKMGAPDCVDVFPIKHGDIPASYVIVYQRVHGLKVILYLDVLKVMSYFLPW